MKRIAILLLLVAVGAAASFAGYRYALTRAHQQSVTAPAPNDRKVLYWYDPMYPQQKFDKAGKSPFMDMQLVPKYADETEAGTVAISPHVVQNLGVRTAEAKRGALETRFEAVGSVAYNDRGIVQLQARAGGFVEKLYARAQLDAVRKGAPLVEILYPEWAGAQEEYLLLLRHESSGMQELAAAARQRLALLGMTEPEIAVVERERQTRAQITLRAPISGIVAELGVREGMTVMPGSTLFKIVDLSTVWVHAEVPETQAAWLRPGSPVQARVAAYPESSFAGRVGAILPEVTSATRTVRARIELANPDERLKPGMFATLIFSGQRGRETLLVPSEAVIRSGTRDVVIVALGGGRFRAAQVEVGAESAGRSEIRSGIAAGDAVVLSGQFLIDSEASLAGTLTRLEASHKGAGKVVAINASEGKIDLEHDPIASLQWPAMSMEFSVADRRQLASLKPGDRVQFELRARPDPDGSYVIERIGK